MKNLDKRIFRLFKAILSQFKYLMSRLKWLRLQQEKNIFLELGSGPKNGANNWTTVDQSGADITWDLREGIPLISGSVSKIYCSHLLEHIPYQELLRFLAECKRVLSEDGEFLVCVPNARLYIEAYMNRVSFNDGHNYYQKAVVTTNSYIDQINYIAYMDGHHHYLFDEENLCNTLKVAGFSNARLRSFDPLLDLKERDFESIYAVATK